MVADRNDDHACAHCAGGVGQTFGADLGDHDTELGLKEADPDLAALDLGDSGRHDTDTRGTGV